MSLRGTHSSMRGCTNFIRVELRSRRMFTTASAMRSASVTVTMVAHQGKSAWACSQYRADSTCCAVCGRVDGTAGGWGEGRGERRGEGAGIDSATELSPSPSASPTSGQTPGWRSADRSCAIREEDGDASWRCCTGRTSPARTHAYTHAPHICVRWSMMTALRSASSRATTAAAASAARSRGAG